MKRSIYLFICLLLFTGLSLGSKNQAGRSSDPPGKSLNVLVSPDLYDLSVNLAKEYNLSFPGTEIRILEAAESGIPGSKIAEGDMGLFSAVFFRKYQPELTWSTLIGRSVIVPVLNARNPYARDIETHGITVHALNAFLGDPGHRTWDRLVSAGGNVSAALYCTDEETMRIAGEYFGSGATVSFIKPANIHDFISAIRKDPCTIGFCRLNNILDPESGEIIRDLRLLPIDRNGNGTIEYAERIYDNVNEFSRGVWIGKYPHELVSNIYSVGLNRPLNDNGLSFMKWLLADGQKFLPGAGYSELLAGERQDATDRLSSAQALPVAKGGGNYLAKAAFYLAVTLLLAGMAVSFLSGRKKYGKTEAVSGKNGERYILDENSVIIPGGIYIDKTHTWAFMEPNGLVKVGIDDFLQRVTGKITRIKIKATGKKVKKGEHIFSVVQNGKQLNLYAPISGTIVEQNRLLEADTSSLNSSPYNAGWICKIDPDNWVRESLLLYLADRYREFLDSEFARLRDFLTNVIKSDDEYNRLILQDGGEVRDCALSEMGPEVWEDFQTNFIDPSRQIWFYELFQ